MTRVSANDEYRNALKTSVAGGKTDATTRRWAMNAMSSWNSGREKQSRKWTVQSLSMGQ
jgi:hypothetical protein